MHKDATVRATQLHNANVSILNMFFFFKQSNGAAYIYLMFVFYCLQAAIVQDKLNISLKPWETTRAETTKHAWAQHKTHLSKAGGNTDFSELLVRDRPGKENGLGNNSLNNSRSGIYNEADVVPYQLVEQDSSLNFLWKTLRTAQPLPDFALVYVEPEDEVEEEDIPEL